MADNDKNKGLKQAFDQWEQTTLAPALAAAPERQEEFVTNSWAPVKRLYTPLDLAEAGFDYQKDVGFPGEYPYTRGINPTMYRESFWLMGQYGGFGSPEETNRRFKYLISQGITALTIALDLPTQMGLDPDHPLAAGEVGKVGVNISSLRDVEIMFKDIELSSLRQVGTIANAIGPVALGWLLALADKKKVSPASFIGFLQNEILKEYVARGAYFLPVKAGVKLVTDVLEYSARHTPHWLPIMLCGYHFREAGATAAQELAFTLSNASAYIDQIIERGLHPDDVAPQFVFFVSANMDFFEEIAKFRALRRLWARMMKERYGCKKPGSMQARLHVYTAGSNLTAQQPMNNVARVACEALAAVLGGVQYLFLSSMDEAFQTPAEEAATVAIRTQQIIAHEVGVTSSVDPMAGSYLVESMTNRIEADVNAYMAKIEQMGGAMAAIESGYFQSEISNHAFRFQQDIEEKKRIRVGVNEFATEKMAKIKPLKQDPEGEAKMKAGLNELKKERDNSKAARTLDGVRRAAESGENLVPSTVEAVKAYATLGEICQVYREVFGSFETKNVVY